jgi:hypothetical protein
MAACRKTVERGLKALERARGVRDMGGVIVDEIGGEAVEIGDADRASFDFKPALDQFSGAGADHVACRRKRYRRQAFALEHIIEGADQVGGRVDEGAVEVEDDGGGKTGFEGHAAALAVRPRSRKVQTKNLLDFPQPSGWAGSRTWQGRKC